MLGKTAWNVPDVHSDDGAGSAGVSCRAKLKILGEASYSPNRKLQPKRLFLFFLKIKERHTVLFNSVIIKEKHSPQTDAVNAREYDSLVVSGWLPNIGASIEVFLYYSYSSSKL